MLSKKNKTKTINNIANSQSFRKSITKLDQYWFFVTYLGHYVKYPICSTQHLAMCLNTYNSIYRVVFLMAFPGSGKSVIMNLSLVLWSILGKTKKKFIIIVSANRNQAISHLNNIKQELLSNQLLINDYGDKLQFGTNTEHCLTLPNLGVKILSLTPKQNLRGLTFNTRHPDLIICDDLDEKNTVEEGKTLFEWFEREVLSYTDANITVVGSMRHTFSFMIRAGLKLVFGEIPCMVLRFPIILNGKIKWTGKFKNMDEINKLEKIVGNRDSWLSNYMVVCKEDYLKKEKEKMMEKVRAMLEVKQVVE